MAAASTSYLRMFLRALRESARQSGGSLYDVLLAAGVARVTATQTGLVVTAAAANGHSYSFGVPAGSALTPDGIAEICGDLLDTYESCRAALVAAGVSSPTDDAILTDMLGRLAPCYNFRPDFSLPLTGAPV